MQCILILCAALCCEMTLIMLATGIALIVGGDLYCVQQMRLNCRNEFMKHKVCASQPGDSSETLELIKLDECAV